MRDLATLSFAVNQILGEYYYLDRSITLNPNSYVHADAMIGLELRKSEYTKSLARLELAVHRLNRR
jgi:hypothetical protein